MPYTTCSNVEVGKSLTANRLEDGVVVFMDRTGNWNEAIDAAAVALEEKSAAALQARAATAVRENEVADAYLIDVERHDGRVRAVHIRERIRALGPTVRTDLGKQAYGLGASFAAAL